MKDALKKNAILSTHDEYTNIEDLLLSQNDLADLGIQIHEETSTIELQDSHLADEYIEIAKDLNYLGIASIQNLKIFLQDNNSFFENLHVKKLNENSWEEIKLHPLFQRRKLEIFSDQEDAIENFQHDFFLLKNGEKIGPFSLDILKEKLEKNEILVTDLIAMNSEEHIEWRKIYTFKEFDRRTKQAILPSRSYTIIKDSQKTSSVNDNEKEKEKDEVLAGLALIGGLKSTKKFASLNSKRNTAPLREQEKFEEKEGPLPKQKLSPLKFLKSFLPQFSPIQIIGFILFTSIAIACFYLFSSKKELSPQEQSIAKIEKSNAVIPLEQKKPIKIDEFNKKQTSKATNPSKGFKGILSNSRTLTNANNKTPPKPVKGFKKSETFNRRNDKALDKIITNAKDDVLHGELTYADHEPSVIYSTGLIPSEIQEITNHLEEEFFDTEGIESSDWDNKGLIQTLEALEDLHPELLDVEMTY